MFKAIAMMKKNPNVTHEEFKDYYEKRHAPMATEAFSAYFSGYRRNFPLRQFLTTEGAMREIKSAQDPGAFPYDVIVEFWFRDKKAMDDVFEVFMARDQKTHIGDQQYLDLSSLRILIVDETTTKLPG